MRVVDKIVYYGKYQGTPETPHEINAIGFGYGLYPESDPIKVDHGFELLHELKASQAIGSKSFGFHLGIAGGLDSGAGSLTLGGYDRSRVIGQPAVFDALPLTDLAVFLVDVVVGVQVGDSPFELIAHPTSFFSSSALESSLSEERGGKSSSLLVQVDPQKPHMGLPTATCNSLARHDGQTCHHQDPSNPEKSDIFSLRVIKYLPPYILEIFAILSWPGIPSRKLRLTVYTLALWILMQMLCTKSVHPLSAHPPFRRTFSPLFAQKLIVL
ncbi:hypothetical protein RB597_003146 [Gaeumannomyces tritici]